MTVPARDAGVTGSRPTALPAFLLLYAALYAAYGTESAYLPSFLLGHGLPVESIGTVLAVGTVVRITAGPAAGRLADGLFAWRGVLAAAAFGSALLGTAYLAAFGLWPLLLVVLFHSAATAPLAPLADSLSVAAAAAPNGFQYGWVRGTGSAAFVGGTLLSGQLVDRFGLATIIVASSSLFAALALATTRVPAPSQNRPGSGPTGKNEKAFGELLAIRPYRLVLLIAALVIGSHALNDAFAVISWRAAGYGGTTVSLLWSESVLAEVAMFFIAGPWLLARVGPAGAAAISAAAGILRWGVMGATTALPVLFAVQALHGFTFALLHLAAMRVIATSVPERLSATAQSLYGNLALGIASATLTFASGLLFEGMGLRAFWVMAALCALAVPLAPGLRSGTRRIAGAAAASPGPDGRL